MKFPSYSGNGGSGNSFGTQSDIEIMNLKAEVETLKRKVGESESEREKLLSHIASENKRLQVHK